MTKDRNEKKEEIKNEPLFIDDFSKENKNPPEIKADYSAGIDLFQQTDRDKPVDYIELLRVEVKKKEEKEEYLPLVIKDTNSEMLTIEEAKETYLDLQFSAAMDSAGEISLEKKRKFDLWIKLNPVNFGLMEMLYAVSRNVNYSS